MSAPPASMATAAARFDETRPLRPAKPARARRRRCRARAARLGPARRQRGWRSCACRASTRQTACRWSGCKRARRRWRAADDVYTNHIHADDLARLIVLALFRAAPGRVYHAVDDSDLQMGEYFDAVADAFGLPRPPRLPRAAAAGGSVARCCCPFMSESRRLRNDRIKSELGMRLHYPRVQDALDKMSSRP